MEQQVLRSCQLVKVIRVVTKEGDGTKENPIRESVSYFTTDGMLIGTLANSAFNEKSPAEQGERKLIIPKRSDGMPDYNAVQKFAELNGLRVKDLDAIQWSLSGDEYVLIEKLRDRMKITSQ